MFNIRNFGASVIFLCLSMVVPGLALNANQHTPYLRTEGNVTTLIVDNKPFLMVAGELHNSTSSAPEYFAEAMNNAAAMNLNTVIASVAWEQFEPEEGHYDYRYVDFILREANARDLKVVLIWFASWKNGESSFTPLWVKRDTARFFRVINKNGDPMTAVSPLCREARDADAKAFAALVKYIGEKDINQTIIMMQIENEVGAFSDMDYGDQALKEYGSPVPDKLVEHLVENRSVLEDELKTAWEANGAKTEGSWKDLFGEQNADAQNFFMSWQYASYMNEIAHQGKEVYNLPMYVNSWLVQFPGEMPGKYPNGGPVARVMDIYKAAAPHIDFCAPDIYLPNFKEVCGKYYRPTKKNPLFIPECERSNPGKAWYALAEYDALGFAPFGVESLVSDVSYAQSFGVLRELLPFILQNRGTGKMRGLLKEDKEDVQELEMGGYRIRVEYTGKANCYGLIAQTGDEDFLVAGIGLKVTFASADPEHPAYIGEVLEGGLEGRTWKTFRQLNGDETWHNSVLFTKGRSSLVSVEDEKTVVTPYLAPVAVLKQSLENHLQIRQVQAPGVYKVKLYRFN